MKQADIHLGGRYFIKDHRLVPYQGLKPNQEFEVVRVVQGKSGKNRYYNESWQYAHAEDLTDVACRDKECPCH